ncbi:GNAT family N-acetyltransferase [Goekera deserti]|uniref:GNAT family N-acetyltransferase n=1 Tax=Goekera deserti TaxID=2497753 RepID=UPI00192E9628|nr:GNAT family N-acetyltransferase [Goekera deserti]
MNTPTACRATAADLPEVAALRHRVFVLEQGVPAEIEQDAADAVAVHVLSRDATGAVVATGRLLERDGLAVIGRMAADRAVRGRGHGAAVLDELHWQAVLRGHPAVELHAQLTARGFYERAGYAPVGEPYREAGIEHVTMRRPLPVLEADPAALRWALSDAGQGTVTALVTGAPVAGGSVTLTSRAAAGGPWAGRLAALARADLHRGGRSAEQATGPARTRDVGPSA